MDQWEIINKYGVLIARLKPELCKISLERE
jgi:hypothetical protein